jgi:hypothetical protein
MTPPAKAGGFSEHARSNPHVSFRRPHAGPQDVSGGVDVPISHVPANLADVSPDGKRLSDDLAALKAPLRCKTRRYSDDSHPSMLGFEREYIDESRPTRIGDGAGEMPVFEQVLDPEILNSNESVALNVVPSRLVRVILTLAGDLEVLLGGLFRRLVAAVGSLLAPRALSLRPPQSLGGPLQTAWVLDGLAFRVEEQVSKANVQPNSRPVAFVGCVPKVADDQDVPMSVSTIDQMSGLWGTFERTVLIDRQAASELLRDSQPSRIRVEVYVPPRPVLSKPNRMLAPGSLEARETHLLSKLATAEKRLRALSRRSASVCTVLCGTCSPPRPLQRCVRSKRLRNVPDLW